MPAVQLVPITEELVRNWKVSPSQFLEQLKCENSVSAELLDPVLDQTLALLQRCPREARWGCFLAIDPPARKLIGTCGFKTGPLEDGSIEIAYFTFPEFEGRGYATQMVREMLARAGTPIVRAHTLPERNASTRILEKCGFTFRGEILDPEDGLVWRWEHQD